MESSGTSRMYEQQTQAFDVAERFAIKPTDSTEDTPPTFVAPDLVELCRLKKEAIANLPKTCCHCNAEYPPGSIIERDDGEIIAYCKLKGACGKSRVIFAFVDTSVPVYAKICRFHNPEPVRKTSNVNELAAVRADEYQLHGIVEPDVKCTQCGKRYDQHEDASVISQADQNGWVERRRRFLSLPFDWPRFQPSTGTWTEGGVGGVLNVLNVFRLY